MYQMFKNPQTGQIAVKADPNEGFEAAMRSMMFVTWDSARNLWIFPQSLKPQILDCLARHGIEKKGRKPTQEPAKILDLPPKKPEIAEPVPAVNSCNSLPVLEIVDWEVKMQELCERARASGSEEWLEVAEALYTAAKTDIFLQAGIAQKHKTFERFKVFMNEKLKERYLRNHDIPAGRVSVDATEYEVLNWIVEYLILDDLQICCNSDQEHSDDPVQESEPVVYENQLALY